MLNRLDAIRMLVSTLTMTFLVLLAYYFLFLGNMSGIVPDSLYLELDQGQAVGFYDGTVEFALYSISSLLFLMPFWLHYLYNLNYKNKPKVIHWIVLFLGLVLCVLTGWRAVQVVVLISPFIVVATEFIVGGGARVEIRLLRGLFNSRNIMLMLAGVIVLLSTFAVIDVRLDAIKADFISGFDFDDASNVSASERTNQFVSLMNAWFNGNFLVGAGNISHTDYLRSDEQTWAYELTYVYLLFSTEIIGVLFYFGLFGWVLLRIRNALIHRSDMGAYVLPLITGVFGLAIGAASNLYFGKFDYLWIILLVHLLAGGVRHQRKKLMGKYVRAA
jgi:ABC-type multidrug transport system fused ATPase/permease subunit